MVCDMDEHGTNGDMKSDALNVAGTALETYQEEKDISRHIKVSISHFLKNSCVMMISVMPFVCVHSISSIKFFMFKCKLV